MTKKLFPRIRLCVAHFLCAWLALPPLLFAAPAPVPANKPVKYPAWWFELEVIPRLQPTDTNPVWPGSYPAVDDLSAANIGQLKRIATKAAEELELNLPGGAGATLSDRVASWSQPPPAGVVRDDLIALSLGQLKYVGNLFYARLQAGGYTDTVPRTITANPTTEGLLVNLGQVKHIFSFDLTLDTDADGIPDW